jgi:hypothetical protein
MKWKPGFKVCFFKSNLYRYTELGSTGGAQTSYLAAARVLHLVRLLHPRVLSYYKDCLLPDVACKQMNSDC